MSVEISYESVTLLRVIKGVSFYSNCAAESVGGITRYFGAIN